MGYLTELELVREVMKCYDMELGEPQVVKLSDTVSCVSVTGKQKVVRDAIGEFTVRLSMTCIRQQDGTYLLDSMHASVPNAEQEKNFLEQEHYRMILNMLDTAFFEWDADNGFYSSDKFTNYVISDGGYDAVMGGAVAKAGIYPEDLKVLQEYVAEINKMREVSPIKVRMKMRDGSYHWTEVIGFVERSKRGEIRRLIGMLRDIDDEYAQQNRTLQIALEEAQKANQAKTAFLSRVSHDMRTPLNGILGLTALMKDRATDERNLHDLSELEMSGKYLLNLINDTLDVSRIESGKLELHPVVCDGRTIFNNAISLAKNSIRGKQIDFHIKADNIPFTLLYVDVARFEQIVMNVFGNAVKFTPEGGKIDVRLTNLSVKDGKITDKLEIEDTGIGMSPEFLPHIFEPFSQEDSTTTSAYNGTGLGLAITKQLLDLAGGDIFVESKVGRGTKFTILLRMPIATEKQIAEWKRNQMDGNPEVDLMGKCILLCEDHPLNAQIATRLLEAKGMKVDVAENGMEGVKLFQRSVKGYYDAILMDIRMPVMDGIEATRRIRSLPRRDARIVPIIAMTANAFSDDMQQTKDAGMDAHLSKPIQTEVLYSTLGRLLQVDEDRQRRKILVVDDLEMNRAVIRVSLERDYEILEAENGKQAMDFVRNTRGLDVVITDIQMPEMDGIELIKQIRCEAKYRHIVIIANTQFGDPEQEEELLELGANDFVYKPTTSKIIELRVRNALRRI